MKALGWIIGITALIAATRGGAFAGMRDWSDRAACTYKNGGGDCLTENEHIKLIARDAAADAVADLVDFCANSYSAGLDARCVNLKKAATNGH